MTHDDEKSVEVLDDHPHRLRFGARLICDLNGAQRPMTPEEIEYANVVTRSSKR